MKSSHSLTIIFLLTMLAVESLSLNVFLQEPSNENKSPQRCYYTTVYSEERLLVELDVPVLKAGLELVLEVALRNGQQNKEKNVVFKQTIKEAKYKKTIEKNTTYVHEMPADASLEYQTCIYLKSKSPLTTAPATDFQTYLPSFVFGEQQTKRNTQSYLISLKLLTNFSHILQDKREQTAPKPKTHVYTKEHLQVLQERSSKLLAIAREQVKMHRENQKTEMRTENHVRSLENSIYSMSITQSGLLVCGSLIHINLMRSYLKGTGLL